MQALLYDVQFSTRTVKLRRTPSDPVSSAPSHEIFFS
jgi:hypothetical protein